MLNTGGVDGASCPPLNGNESTQWTLIGTQPCAGAQLSLAPPSQTQQVGDTATVTATLTNGCGTALQGAAVIFNVTSGPNTGTTGNGATDTSGQATFSYSSLAVGTDTVQSSVSNPAGTITSNPVQVTWTAPFAPGGGAFVIGDHNSSVGSAVTFWGAHWADQLNYRRHRARQLQRIRAATQHPELRGRLEHRSGQQFTAAAWPATRLYGGNRRQLSG